MAIRPLSNSVQCVDLVRNWNETECIGVFSSYNTNKQLGRELLELAREVFPQDIRERGVQMTKETNAKFSKLLQAFSLNIVLAVTLVW